MNRTIAVYIRAELAGFTARMGAAAAQVRQMGKEAEQVATRTDTSSRRALDTIGKLSLALSAGLALGLGLSVRAAADFDRAMRNVSTVSEETRTNFKRTSDQVLAMSREFPQSAKVAAEALYEISSSGFDGAEAMNVLRVSMLGASAGLTTAETAAAGISAALNAYGKSGFEAARVNNILFATVELGVVKFEELAQQMGDWVAAAATAKVPLEHASAALATMTLSGLSAAEASTSLNRVMQELIQPSEALTGLFNRFGYESGTAAVEQLGLHGVMKLVNDATGGQSAALLTLFPEIRAHRGVVTLLAADMGNYNRVQGQMTDEVYLATAAQRAFNEQSKGFSFQLDLAKNNAAAFAISLGQLLLPILQNVVNFLSGVISMFNDLPGPMKVVLAASGILAAVVLGLGGAYLLLAQRIAAVRALNASLTGTAANLSGALGAASKAAGILGAALTVATFVLAKYGQEKARVRQSTDGFVTALKAEEEGVKNSVAAEAASQLAKKGLIDLAERLGVSLDLVTRAATGDAAAMDELARMGNNASAALRSGFLSTNDWHFASTKAAVGTRDLADGVREIHRGFAGAKGEIKQAADAVTAMQGAANGLSPELVKLQIEADEFGNKMSGAFLDAFNVVSEFAAALDANEAAMERAAAAEDRLAEAVADSAERVAEAQENVSEATEDAAERIADAQENVSDATEDAAKRVEDAERDLARAYEEAAEQVEDAEDKLTDAQERQRDAQEALTQARIDAQEELEDLRRSVERSALSEERAELRLLEARQKLSDVNSDAEASDLDRRRAALDLRDAELDLVDAQDRRTEQGEQLSRMEQEGIEGSERVVDAREALIDAEKNAADAQRNLAKTQGESARQIADAQQRLYDEQVEGAERVAEAQKELTKAQADGAKQVADAQRQLAKAQADGAKQVTEAQKALAEAMQEVADTDMEGFFEKQLRDAEEFATGLVEAARRGLDPALIRQLLEAGPKEALPVIRAITADHSGQLISRFNEFQSNIRAVSKDVLEVARANHIALTTTNKQVADDYETAMELLAAKARLGGKATAEALAKELGIGVEDVKRVTAEYLISVELSTSEAKDAAERNAREMMRQLNDRIQEGTFTSDQRLVWFKDATKTNLNALPTDAEGILTIFAAEMYEKIHEGTHTTDERMAWWARATKNNLESVIDELIDPAVLRAAQQDTGNILGGIDPSLFQQADGGVLPREALIQPATGRRGLIQWAEPETQGEAFIPLAPNKRHRSTRVLAEVADRFGFTLMEYAYGGIHDGIDEFGFDRPPSYPSSTFSGRTADTATGMTYELVRAWVSRAMAEGERRRSALAAAGPSGPPGSVGEGWRAITDWLESVGEPHTITSTFRPGAITSSGNLSNHALGKAVDLVSDNMMRLFNTLLRIERSLSELFYDPAGFSIKNATRVDWTVGGHEDHVHAATFDRGGVLAPGWNSVYNATGASEPLVPGVPLNMEIDYRRLAREVSDAIAERLVPALGSAVERGGVRQLVMDRRVVGEIVSKEFERRRREAG